MPDDFTKCGCCISSKAKLSPHASDFEKLVAEIERLKAAPDEKTTRPPATGSRALGTQPSNLWLELTTGRAKPPSGPLREPHGLFW